MKGPALTIYFVAPEANSASMRKLKGTAAALGVSVKVVENNRQLPTTPEANSILVLPENIKLGRSDDHGSSWTQIYQVTTQNTASSNGCSKIILPSGLSAMTPDIKILHTILSLHGIHSFAVWHAATSTFDGSCSKVKNDLARWLKHLKIYNYPAVVTLNQSLEVIASKLSNRSLNVLASTDGYVFDFVLHLSNCVDEEKNFLLECLSLVTSSWMIADQCSSELHVKIHSELAVTTSRQIKVLRLGATNKDDTDDKSDREAS